MSGLFAAAFVRHGERSRALEESVARVFALLAETHRRGDAELALVAVGDAIVTPAQQFAARMVG
jgi:pyridoxal/pyridoxine/pyridoxamine kinase